MDRIVHGVTKSQIQLSNFQFHLHIYMYACVVYMYSFCLSTIYHLSLKMSSFLSPTLIQLPMVFYSTLPFVSVTFLT